jgi:hypothetical protein
MRKNGDLRGTPRVDVIGSSGEKLGVMPLAEALRLAMKQGRDLVEVNPNASPPVCKLLDLDKHGYAELKKAALARRKTRKTNAAGSLGHEVLLDPAVLAQLCEDLKPIVEAEVAEGNAVCETYLGFPRAVNVWLAFPFRAKHEGLPPHVTLHPINDPHYWLAEYVCAKHDQTLACKYAQPKE